MNDRPSLAGMTPNFLLATPMIGVLWWLSDGAWPPMTGIAGGIYIGLFEMSLAFYCWSLALKATDNTAKISNLIFLSPFISCSLSGGFWVNRFI